MNYINVGEQEGALLLTGGERAHLGGAAGERQQHTLWLRRGRLVARGVHNTYRVGREIEAGRVWTNCYHVYPAHAAFGGYKQSGFGRETRKMVLDHYRQTKLTDDEAIEIDASTAPTRTS